MNKLIPINSKEDRLPAYRNSPVCLLLEYHNLGLPFETYDKAKLLVGMCMDNRKHLPNDSGSVIRTFKLHHCTT
jgi:carbonic anhydrase